MSQPSESLIAMARAVAPLVDGTWTVKVVEGNVSVQLISDEGELHLLPNWRDKSRLIIMGDLTPKYPHNEGPYSSDLHREAREITVGINRTPQAIAAEITRRLLPAYREQQAKWRERCADYDAGKDRQQAGAERLAQAMGVEPNREKGKVYRYEHRRTVSFEVTMDGDVKVEVHYVPLELALKIAALVK